VHNRSNGSRSQGFSGFRFARYSRGRGFGLNASRVLEVNLTPGINSLTVCLKPWRAVNSRLNACNFFRLHFPGRVTQFRVTQLVWPASVFGQPHIKSEFHSANTIPTRSMRGPFESRSARNRQPQPQRPQLHAPHALEVS